jgi:hypothetical protein
MKNKTKLYIILHVLSVCCITLLVTLKKNKSEKVIILRDLSKDTTSLSDKNFVNDSNYVNILK